MAKILFVDDSETIRAPLVVMLRNVGHTVLEASDGEAALELMNEHRANPFQLVVLDLNMPKMGGLDVLEMLRADDVYANVDVLLLTTESAEHHKQRARELGVRAWIMKPCVPEKFLHAVSIVCVQPKP